MCLPVGQKIGLDRQATLYEEQPSETHSPSTYPSEPKADGSSNSVGKTDGYYNDSNYQYDGTQTYDYSAYGQDYSSYNYDYNYDYNYGYNEAQSGEPTTSTTTTTTTVASTSTATTSTATSSSASAKPSTSTTNPEEGYGYYDDTGYYYNGQW